MERDGLMKHVRGTSSLITGNIELWEISCPRYRGDPIIKDLGNSWLVMNCFLIKGRINN